MTTHVYSVMTLNDDICAVTVKTVESKVTVEDFNNLFHSDKEDNINNDANPTEKECKPDQVRVSGLSTQPTSKNDYDTLTADATVVQQETESKSATQTHVEADFNIKNQTLRITQVKPFSLRTLIKLQDSLPK